MPKPKKGRGGSKTYASGPGPKKGGRGSGAKSTKRGK